MRYDEYVISLTFITNKGTKSKIFGKPVGEYKLFEASPHGHLIGLEMRCNGTTIKSYIHAIGFVWIVSKYVFFLKNLLMK